MKLGENGNYYLDSETIFSYNLFCEVKNKFTIKSL